MLATDLVRARDILESVRRDGGSDNDDDRYLGQMDLPARSLRVKDRRELYLPMVVVYLMVATLVAIVLYPHMVVTVPSGYVGVLWKRFGGGTVLDPRRLKNEGFNLILPWNEVFLYDLRLQSFTESYNAISSDGVNLTATVIVRFRLQRNAVPVLHQ